MLGHPSCFKQRVVNIALQSKKATQPLPPTPAGKARAEDPLKTGQIPVFN
ncbi:hypothetical protein SHA02_07960 [Salisediminibacterium halotolerans]|nr:hypothetical protein SHA02_07960 [Salisediminibacterium halotolerans]